MLGELAHNFPSGSISEMDLPPFLEKETSSIPGAAAHISNNGSTEIPGAETSSYIVNTTNQPTKCLTVFHNEWMRCTWQMTPING